MKHCKIDDVGFMFPYFVLIILMFMCMGILPGNMLVYVIYINTGQRRRGEHPIPCN